MRRIFFRLFKQYGGEILQPLVSIIVPVYNGQDFIVRCIKSLTAQSCTNIEIILVNDGSKDDTPKICEKLASQDSRIKFLSQKNKGVSAARNLGLDHATGYYICFVDADDYVEKDFVEKHLSSIEQEEDIDISVCGFVDETLDKNVIHKSENVISYIYEVKNFKKSDFIPYVCWQIMVRRTILNQKDHIRFDESITIKEDMLFLYALLMNSRKVAVLSDILYHSVHREDSLSHVALTKNGVENYMTALGAYSKILEVTETNAAVNQMVALAILKDLVKMGVHLEEAGVLYNNYRDELNTAKKITISAIRKYRYSFKETIIIIMITVIPKIYVKLAN